MRIRQISVDKLFGIFDHRIPLNMEERITILHGLNGYGKTIVLRLVNDVLNGDGKLMHQIPFASFALRFDDGATLRIEQHRGEGRPRVVHHRDGPSVEKGPRIQFTYQRPREAPNEYVEELPRSTNLLEQVFSTNPAPPEWFSSIRSSNQVRLIQTQRIERDAPSQTPAVEKYSSEISDKIRAVLAAYATRSQELDSTFPLRLLQHQTSPATSTEEMKGGLDALDQRRLRLAGLGFLDPKEHQDLGQHLMNGAQLAVLGLYVKDVGEKLDVFEALAAKIELFLGIINRRFQYKSLAVHRDKGFVITTATGAELPPAALSSGEQHELVLFYELLFNTSPDSLVLIDEPELSLHIAWQNEFLKDLEAVVKLAGFDVLLATHSPDIIAERWDLTVRLAGPNDPTPAKVA